MRLLTFGVDEHRYGITSDAVLEIVRAVAITPLPGSPSVIEGIIDVRGTIVPVFDLRVRFGLPTRAVVPADQFVLVRAANRVAALHVDRVEDLVDAMDTEGAGLDVNMPGASHIAGAVTLDDGMVLIHDVATFLSAAEASSLDAALAAQAAS